MDNQEIPGFEIPIHRALTEEILMAGAPRKLVFLNGTVAAVLGLALQSWYALPINVIIHLLAIYATKRDPHFLEVFQRHMQDCKDYYST